MNSPIPTDTHRIAIALSEMSQNIATENNRATASPIYVVQQKVRQLGDPNADDPYIWYSNGDWYKVDDEKAQFLDDAEEMGFNEQTKGYTKDYYRDVYQFVQPFFTEQGANEYIRINGHNLKEPRIYVESAYRNAEWQAIRAFLQSYSSVNGGVK